MNNKENKQKQSNNQYDLNSENDKSVLDSVLDGAITGTIIQNTSMGSLIKGLFEDENE